MIGLTVTIVKVGMYARDGKQSYYFDGSLGDAIALVESHRQKCGDDWYQIEYELSDVKSLPSDIAPYAERFGLRDLQELAK